MTDWATTETGYQAGENADRDSVEDPAVTVVVVSYFSGDSLRDCLDSVVSQSGVDARALVIDNGAPEARADGHLCEGEASETAEICREYEAVEYVENDANVGFPPALNRGFDLAETGYLAALNPDATFGEGALRRLVDRLEPPDTGEGESTRSGGAAFAAPKILLADDPDRISTCGLVNHVTGISFNQAADLPADHPAWSRERDLESISGCAFATTAAAWERFGGFEPGMFLYKDDVDLSWACAMADERIRFVPDAVVYHDYERELDPFKLYHVEHNRLLLLAKYLPASAVALLPSLLLGELLAWAMAATLGVEGLRAKIRAYGVLLEPDARSTRRRGRRFRDGFPDGIDALAVEIPWRDLRRTGVVPDTPLVSVAGAAVNAVFRANVALYRRLVD